MTHPLSEELRQAANEELLERKIRLLRRAADALDYAIQLGQELVAERDELQRQLDGADTRHRELVKQATEFWHRAERAEARAARYKARLEAIRSDSPQDWGEFIDEVLREPETANDDDNLTTWRLEKEGGGT